jgi:hypothetical protein
MATYRDPVTCFAPLEVVERLIELREEQGYNSSIYLHSSIELAEFLDAHGFDVYVFNAMNKKINYGDYRAPMVPGGDFHHCSPTAH